MLTDLKNIWVIIPAHNEEQTLGDVINRIPKVFTILVVDDCSTDCTNKIAKDKGVLVVKHTSNLGVGAAFQTGTDFALDHGAEIVVNIDGDGQMYPEDIHLLVEPIIKREADVCIGTRFKFKNIPLDMPRSKKFGNKLFTKLIGFLTGKKFSDTQCGFRAYSRKALKSISLFGDFTYTQESLLEMVRKRLSIVEVPLYIKGQRIGKSRVVKNVFDYGLKALSIIIRSWRDYSPMKFFGSWGLFFSISGILIFMGFVIRKIFFHGAFMDYPWFFGGSFFLVIIGLIVFFIALFSDMNIRTRMLIEKIMFRLR